MDEPTAALGPQETAQVGELVRQLKAEGIGIFLISHDIHDVFDLADRVCVMKNGRVYEGNTLNEIWPRQRAMPKQWWMTHDALAPEPGVTGSRGAR